MSHTRRTYKKSNQYYGHDKVLKKYTKSKIPLKIMGKLQHGWRRDNGEYSTQKLPLKENKKNTILFVWNSYNLKEAQKIGCTDIRPIGSPFIYLKPLKRINTIPKSLILFPFHSWEKEPFKNEIVAFSIYIQEIRQIQTYFKTITICLYWYQNQNKMLTDLLKEEGFMTICLGKRDGNNNFLDKFQKTVSRYEYVSSNVFSTAFFYALFLKKKSFIFGSHDAESINWIAPPLQNLQKNLSNQYPELLWKNFNHIPHYLIGCRELGYEYKKSPSDLKKLLGLDIRIQGRYLINKLHHKFSQWRRFIRLCLFKSLL